MSATDTMARAGVAFPEILIPAPHVDLHRWAVIACDQFTSDHRYWQDIARTVGEAPSTLHMILPEIYLDSRSSDQDHAHLRAVMEEYLGSDTLIPITDAAVYIRRTLRSGAVRQGLVVALDLDAYDYHRGSQAIVRASEKTIPDRLPPRAAIRRGAPLESPHVLVLYDDRPNRLMALLEEDRKRLRRLYRTPLMGDGGMIEGYEVPVNSSTTQRLAGALEAIARESMEAFQFVFATGDGNHSLAAAKTVWEERKANGAHHNDPYRYCLVELVNVYDAGLPFHPIHRVTGAPFDRVADHLRRTFPGAEELEQKELQEQQGPQTLTVAAGDRKVSFQVPRDAGLAVGVADDLIAELGTPVDYVHGDHEALEAAARMNGCAVLLQEFPREELFPVVASSGALPRKAFSLGEARDKRYYLECRRLER